MTGLLVGNTLVNVSAASLASLTVERLLSESAFRHWGLPLMILVVTVVILLFGEILPKVVAVKRPLLFARKTAWLLHLFMGLFLPVSVIFETAVGLAARVVRIRPESPFVTEEEVQALIEVGEEKGAIDSVEREMIHSIFEFKKTMVREIMVPRMDMVAVEKSKSIGDVLEGVKTKGHSRIPVYDGNIDNIIGILYVKDFLPYLAMGKPIPPLEDLIRKPYFVPETKQIDELLKEFQKERLHMAIVVDEYGGTAGLVTLEDIIEEIVGEIRDEYDREQPLIRKLDDQTWMADGKINIEELNERLSIQLPTDEEYETLGGFLFSEFGRIPQEKEEVVFREIRFQVEKIERRRIRWARILLPPLKDAERG